jgi:proline iminopeptidase
MLAKHHPASPAPREGYIPVRGAALYYRETGRGQPIILLHGGPDFDHNYFLPDMDRLAGSFRLIYYDQRGRGQSAGNARPEDVTVESEIADLEAVREHFGLESVAVLGHSWGGVLAMEYAIRYPARVSRLIVMNTGPASHVDYMLLRRERRKNATEDVERMREIAATAAYRAGDIEADAAYYRIHFRTTVRQPALLERVVGSLRANFTPEGILKARAIESRLLDETWLLGEYDLFPRLRQLNVPALIIHGDTDIVPVECAAHVAEAIPGARLVLLRDTGHFSFIERTDEIGKAIANFFG